MDFKEYVRTPFTVEAVEITKENIEELSEMIGELKHNDDGIPYIIVDRAKVQNIDRVFLGFYLTKMRDNIRCYTPYVFRRQFTEMTPELQPWIEYMSTRNRRKVAS